MRTAKKRNWLLIALLLVLACIQAVNAARAPALPSTSSLIVPLVIVFGGGWAIAFLAAARGYWQRTFSRAAVLLLLSLFVLYYAARLAIFARADYDHQRMPFIAAVAMLAAV